MFGSGALPPANECSLTMEKYRDPPESNDWKIKSLAKAAISTAPRTWESSHVDRPAGLGGPEIDAAMEV